MAAAPRSCNQICAPSSGLAAVVVRSQLETSAQIVRARLRLRAEGARSSAPPVAAAAPVAAAPVAAAPPAAVALCSSCSLDVSRSAADLHHRPIVGTGGGAGRSQDAPLRMMMKV